MKKSATTMTKPTTTVSLAVDGLAPITEQEQRRVNGGRNNIKCQWPKFY